MQGHADREVRHRPGRQRPVALLLATASAITSSTTSAGNTRVNKPTETRSDRRVSVSGFFHPARATPPNYTVVVLT